MWIKKANSNLMTIKDFSTLCREEQIEHLYEHGVYIGKHLNGRQPIILYQLDSFYVEIFYTKYRQVIDRLNCFTSVEKLDPYLVEMDMMELITW